MPELDQREKELHSDVRRVVSFTMLAVMRSFSIAFGFLGFAIVAVLLSAALLELASWAIWSIHPLTRSADLESQIKSPVYIGAEWAPGFWQEEAARRNSRRKHSAYVPFRLWSVVSWQGKYINNDPGPKGYWRRTVNSTGCEGRQKVNLWTFGGSTMYGTAVPDWATLPSYLSHELNSGGDDCVVVSNFGVEGYVTDQELILLEEQLKAGGKPDIVVFYDGVNDASLAWPPAASPTPHFEYGIIKSRIEGSLGSRLDFLQKSYSVRLAREWLTRLHALNSVAPLVAADEPNIIAVLNNYEANLRLARDLAQAYKFKLYCFWQPMLGYGHKPFVPFEQQLATRDASGTSFDSAWFLTNVAVYREAELHAARDENFVFLGDLFDSTKEPVYVDEGHLGPSGNEIAAHAIASYIRERPTKQ